MKSAYLLLSFPCLMLFFVLAISYIERLFRPRKPAPVPTKQPHRQLNYYYLPTVDGYRFDALSPERPTTLLLTDPAPVRSVAGEAVTEATPASAVRPAQEATHEPTGTFATAAA